MIAYLLIGAVCVAVAAVFLVGLLQHKELQQLRNEALEKLERDAGQYDDQSIVLYQTSKVQAEELAELLGAELRITKDGRFAKLTLPGNTTIRDVYANDEMIGHIEKMSADYQVRVSELTEDVGAKAGERLPTRPQYSVSDTDYELQTYLDYLNMQNVWSSYTGSGITVAVIDTGIDTDHPEFAGRISEYSYNASEDKIVKDWVTEDGSYDWSLIEDEVGHGTAVTGVIAATMHSGGVVGIAPDVNIVVIKAECDENGNFKRTSDLVFGIYYAIERDVNAVNMSFGTYGPNVFAEALQLAYDSDVVCVAAAGNDGTSALMYPAADEHVIGVGALAENSWALAAYSNYGENTNLVAPGSTYTSLMGGTYGTMNGTSLASPIVTGAVALFLQNNPYLTADDVTEVLYASSADLGDLGRDWIYGFGALDLFGLLLEERGTVSFDMLTDELEDKKLTYVKGHTLQELPEPERLYAVFDGWYYDDTFTQEYTYYEDKFYNDITLYAKWVNEDDGVPYTYVELEDGTIEIRSYTGKRRFITIPEKIDGKIVSSIGEEAFKGQTRLREVGLPSGLTQIRRSAFEGCSNLVWMEVPENVTVIGERAFKDNIRLSTVAFLGNNKLSTVGYFAFSGCSSLRSLELPANLKNMDGSALFGAQALTSVTVQKGNTAFSSRDGVLFNATGSTLIVFPAAKGSTYTLPEHTVSIGSYAFGYAKLKTVDLSRVAAIGASAFAYSMLEEVVIPDTTTTVGESAFQANSNLASVSIGSGLTTLKMYVFAYNASLLEITIPNNIQIIEGCAFNACGLTKLTFEENSNLWMIGANAFVMNKIEKLDVPASVVSIMDNAFAGNPLAEVNFASDSALHTIGGGAFSYCSPLWTIELPSRLVSIGEMAFAHAGLESATVPASVSELGNGVFAGCMALTAIKIEDGNTVYHDIDGVVYTIDNTVLHSYPSGKSCDYMVESAVTVIAPYAFGFSEVWNVTLPESLTQISEYAFYACNSMGAIQIPDNVKQIGRYAFAEDWNLRYINFNATSKLPRISYGAFAYTGLYEFTVPANVSTMAQGAFEGCRELHTFIFAENSKLESISAYMFDGCTNLQNINFMQGSALTSIQAHGLEGMTRLQSIDLTNTKLTNIDNFAFRFCESLQSLTLPDTIKNVGRYAFYACESLSELSLPESIEHIGSYAFLGTNELDLYLASESMPAYLDENWDHGIRGYYTGVTEVKTEGDYKYAVLTSGNIAIIEYLGTETTVDLTTVDFGAPITTIGGSAFKDSTVAQIVLPETLTTIQAEAFRYTALESVTIPASVTFIGREAFANTDIKTLTFANGSGLNVIEQYAFENIQNLTSVTLPKSVTTLGTGVFQKSGLTSVTFEQGIDLKEIPQNAFLGTKLTIVTLPDSVETVNHNAFRDILTLKTVDFGNSDGIRLLSNVFYNTGLETLHIPANITFIGEYCFVGLENLTDITVDANNPNYVSNDGLLLTKSGRKLVAVPAGRTGTLTVPLSVEEIGFGAFENTALDEVNFDANANILTFGYRAFFGAKNLTEIHVPASVVSIDYYAFAYCEKLHTVTFAEDNNLKGIYEGAFCGDINLENITIPDSIVEISDFAFYGCTKIDKLPLGENNTVKGIYDYAFAYTSIGGEFAMPETLVDIGAYAFLGTDITKLTIPDTNKKDLIIGIGAFEGCNQLTEVTLPFIGASYEDNELSWFGYIFGAGSYEANQTYVPESLKTVTITDGITMIGTGAFYNLYSVEAIKIPHSVSMVASQCFGSTPALHEFTNVITPYYYDWFSNRIVYAEDMRTECIGVGVVGRLQVADSVKFIDLYDCTELKEVLYSDQVNSVSFAYCSNLTSVYIPYGVTEIKSTAFMNCYSLENVDIPDSVISIGSMAFYNCFNLTSIDIPDNVINIGDSAFLGCTSLTTVNIPNGITVIEKSLFYDCSSLQNITIPDNVTRIENYAFHNCSGLTSITLPSQLTSIEEYSFAACNNLWEIRNNSVLELTIGAYDNGYVASSAKCIYDRYGNKTYLADGLTDFYYIDTVDEFRFACQDGQYTLVSYFGDKDTITLPENFQGNLYEIFSFEGAEHIIVPDAITTIGWQAFYNNKSLKSIDLPESLSSIGAEAFYGCTALQEVEIPDHVETIESLAFYGCSSLKRAVLPKSLKELGYVFGCCYELSEVIFQEGVVRIGGYAFSECHSLKTVCLPESLEELSFYAFRNSGLKSIHIPSNVSILSADVFAGCYLEDITVSSDNPYFNEIDGVLYNHDVTAVAFVPQRIKEVTIPATIQNIDGAFTGCKELETVRFEEGTQLDNIGIYAFSYCASLKNIEIPSSVTVIRYGAFMCCDSLTSFMIPEGIQRIEEDVFMACGNLQTITLPASLSVIEAGFTSGCTALKNIFVSENNENYCVYDGILYDIQKTKIFCIPRMISGCITIPDTVTSLPPSAFHDCNFLEGVILPSGLTTIESFTFNGCVRLSHVSIPDGVTTIGEYAFSSAGLQTITLPKSLKVIKSGAFCYAKLTSITIPENVCEIAEDAFIECTRLFEVRNHSKLEFGIGSRDYGELALYARVLIDKNGNKSFANPDEKFEYLDTPDGFRFYTSYDEVTLFAYLGNENVVTLPLSCNGQAYRLCAFMGAKHVVIPDGFTQVDAYAFYYNNTLESVSIPDSVTSIESCAFMGCDWLVSVHIPDSVTRIDTGAFGTCQNLSEIEISDSIEFIGGSAFTYTEYYDNLENWKNGCLYLEHYLLEVSDDIDNFVISEDTTLIAQGAFDGCHLLKYIEANSFEGLFPLYLSNLETLAAKELGGTTLFNILAFNVPITLKNIVICDGVAIDSLYRNPNFFENITGVTIYIEALEQDLRWDDNFPGWNYGNKVVYGDEWNWVTFYDENGSIISREPRLNHEIIRLPIHEIESDPLYSYSVIGWDLDGDGIADSIPATTATDLELRPIVEKTVCQYTVIFAEQNGNVFHSLTLPYGAEITLPEAPAKQGYDFVGWIGYTKGMTVTSDVTFTAQWKHHGSGHVYAEPVWIDPTCTEQGYNKHACTICGEYYGTDYTDALGHDYQSETVAPTCTEKGYALYTCTACGETYQTDFTDVAGHSYGEWSIDKAPTCTEEGSRHRICAACDAREDESVPANGHAYTGKIVKEPTCNREGTMRYTCSECGNQTEESVSTTAHQYEKKYASKSWIRLLIERLLNILFGYEGDRAYYYACTECGNLCTVEEAEQFGAGVQSASCKHELSDWTEYIAATCVGNNVEARFCTLCDKPVEFRTGTELGDHNYIDGVCTVCGDIDFIYGDANGDGVVDGRDVTRLLRYMASFDPETNTADVELALGADCNGDGVINGKDATHLLLHLANYDPVSGESSVVLDPNE